MRYTEEVKREYQNSDIQRVGLSDRADLEREYDMIRPYGKGKMSNAAQMITLVVALFLIALMVFMVVYKFTGENETVAKFGTIMMYVVPYGIAFLISFMLLTKKIASKTVYDRYDHKWSSEVEIDSTETIYCRKNDPASIISPNKGMPVILLLLGGITLLVIFSVGFLF